jgi:photosynthetic reaction center H subunit
MRADTPDLTHHGDPKIVPMRVAADHSVAMRDTDPRGLPIYGGDHELAGHVVDLWVDRMEMMFRYLEVQTRGGRRVLVPIMFARIKRDGVYVHALLADQFEGVPATRHPEQITMLEEERIPAFFGAGLLYASPERQEPLF